jgi:hypothetical protein
VKCEACGAIVGNVVHVHCDGPDTADDLRYP